MLKGANASIAATAIAAAPTFISNSRGGVVARPLAQPAQTALQSCTQRPWPYPNYVGTPLGNLHIRLVTTDRRVS